MYELNYYVFNVIYFNSCKRGRFCFYNKKKICNATCNRKNTFETDNNFSLVYTCMAVWPATYCLIVTGRTTVFQFPKDIEKEKQNFYVIYISKQ